MEEERIEKAEKAEPVSFADQCYSFAEFIRSSALTLDDRDMIAAKFEDAGHLIEELVKRAWPA